MKKTERYGLDISLLTVMTVLTLLAYWAQSHYDPPLTAVFRNKYEVTSQFIAPFLLWFMAFIVKNPKAKSILRFFGLLAALWWASYMLIVLSVTLLFSSIV